VEPTCPGLKPGVISFTIKGAKRAITPEIKIKRNKKILRTLFTNFQASFLSFRKYSENKGKKATTTPPAIRIL